MAENDFSSAERQIMRRLVGRWNEVTTMAPSDKCLHFCISLSDVNLVTSVNLVVNDVT